MATAAAFASSPARMAHRHSVVVISSSPEFPSICDLLSKATKKPPLRSGSNAAPVPEDAPASFTSAASIWQASRMDSLEAIHTVEGQPSRSAASAVLLPVPALDLPEPIGEGAKREGTARAKQKSAGATRKKKAEQFTSRDAAGKTVTEAAATEAPAKKPARKPRTAKATALGQTTLPKGKVTKPSSKEAPSKKKTETVSRHFAQKVSPPILVSDLEDPIQDEPLAPEPAMRRRIDWTPPPESATLHHPADSLAAQDLSSSAMPDPNGVFKTLEDTYGRAVDLVPNANDPPFPATTADILGKRKLIEMVAPVGNRQKTPEASPRKPKAVKKKPRTITELATAAYRQPEEETLTADPQQDSLLDYLDTTGGPTAATGNGPAPKGKGSKRPRAKPKAAKKKDEPPKQFLLSPTSAMRQVARQDFVFGTASQLATEDDPALLRALHEAMNVSNQPDGDPYFSPHSASSNLAIRRRPGTGLWTAGARYDGGELPDWEVLDLTRSFPSFFAHAPSKPPAVDQHTVQAQATENACIEIDMSDDTMDFSNSPPVGHPTQLLPSLPRPATQTLHLDDSGPSSHDRPQTPPHEPNFAPPPSNQEQHQLLLSQSSSPRQERPDLPHQPNFELYTDARLAKEVASYGFKAVKKRAAMIALLGQCWASQNKSSLGSRIGQATISTASTLQAASPSRPRGRPRKTPAPSASDVANTRGRRKSISASNSESEASPKKRPRGRPRKDSMASISSAAEPPVPPRRGRKKSVDGGTETPSIEKPARGRPKKDAVAPVAKRAKAKAASPKRVKSPAKPAAAPATPKRRKAPAKSVVEIPDSESDDPFASTPPSSPEDQGELFSSPPAMDLSVTEDTETSLMASPTTQQVTLFRYITQAVISAPRTTDPANPSWHDKMLMYDPIILEDLTGWLNAGQLDRVGHDGEVSPGDVKRWCESKSVCCLWRENLRGKERKRF